MSVYDEILRKIEDGKLAAISTVGCRNEEEQQVGASRKLYQLKKAQQKKSKLLLLNEYAFDFNPFDASDRGYSVRKKYRLSQSPTQVIIDIKNHINEGNPLSESCKDQFVRKSGISDWDTTTEGVTEQDKAVFKKWLVPIVFTIKTARILNPDFTGMTFPIPYRVDVDVDPITGEILGKVPNCVLINSLQSDMWFESNNIQQELINQGKLDLTEKMAKEANSKRADEIITVKRILPQNYLLAVEIPLNNKRLIDDTVGLAGWSEDDLFKSLKIVPMTTKISNQLEAYKNGDNEIYDVNTDFYEIEMVCHNEEDKMQLGLNTEFPPAGVKLVENKAYSHVCDLIKEYRDSNSVELDELFMSSVRVKTLTPELDKELVDAIAPTMNIESEYMTKAILQRNASIVSLLFDDEGDMKIADAECGDDSIADGTMSEDDLSATHSKISKDEVSGVANQFSDILGGSTSFGDDLVEE